MTNLAERAALCHANDGADTLSKSWWRFPANAPRFLELGLEQYVWDIDGNRYLDLIMGLGATGVLGHTHPVVAEAIKHQIAQGVSFSLPHRLVVEVAEAIQAKWPVAERCLFFKNGGDATNAAVRLARAVTGRWHIGYIQGCYHGHDDWFIEGQPPAWGVPQMGYLHAVPFRDYAALNKLFGEHDLAAFIIEHGGKEPNGFYSAIRHLCDKYGVLLIWDEIVTGLRWPGYAAYVHYGIRPDLICLGKALASGMPLSCLAGQAGLMREFGVVDPVFCSTTFGGEAASLAAAKATLDFIGKVMIFHLWKIGAELMQGFNNLVGKHGLSQLVRCSGYPPRSGFEVDGPPENRALFLQEMIKQSILCNWPNFMSTAFGPQELDKVLSAADLALKTLKAALESDSVLAQVEGPLPRAIWTQR